jgi:hypothetical protein
MKCNKLYTGIALMLLQTSAIASQNLWQEVSFAQRSAAAPQSQSARYYQSDTQTLKQILSRAGMEGGAELDSRIELPLASGQIKQFQLIESPVMAPELAAKYPDIKTYKVTGIENPLISGRLSYTAKGFSAMISTPSDTYYLDPTDDGLFRASSKSSSNPGEAFNCGVVGHNFSSPVTTMNLAARTAQRVAGSMRLYRLAVAATAEYVDAVGGTKGAAMSEIVRTINRVNEIYQRDLGVKLELVANNDAIIFDGGLDSDPYTSPSSGLEALLPTNQETLDARIGSANYDIGHVFSTGGGGIATVGSVCSKGYKAQGATGLSWGALAGDKFYIDYVAHEMGHQFGADHTFNGTTDSCHGTNRSPATAFEPGSGSSIMAYAGLCGAENLQSRSDAVFHAGSLAQINQFTTSGGGEACGSLQSITNNPSQPTATAGSDYTIPTQTPFVLSATASDADGDTLSYTWDEMDAGTATSYDLTDSSIPETFGMDLGDNALFRSYLPQAQPERYFPRLDSVLSSSSIVGETVPTTTRALKFTLTVRDGKGGLAQDSLVIDTVDTSSSFSVTSDSVSDTILDTTAPHAVTWNVGNTNLPAINCQYVNIDLLKFDSKKTTYCEENLITHTLNNGVAFVNLPNEYIPKARFKVSCANNVFYALSSGDLTINAVFPANVSCKSVVPENQEQTSQQIDIDPDTHYIITSSNDSGGGGGALGFYGLLGFLMLFGFRRQVH